MTELRARFASVPASVPGARRFVTDGLSSWGLDSLADDAALCVTELAANAALHSVGSFMTVVLTAREGGVRVTVEDDGAVPSAVVVPRAHYDDPDPVVLDLVDQPTTGRGLAIVEVLASGWGVEDAPAGKRVWADFGTDELPPYPDGHPVPEPSRAPLPPGWTLVTLAGCPVRLSLRQDEHLDELVRELQLLNADEGNERSRSVAATIQGLLVAPAHARLTGRQTALLAEEQGQAYVDVEMALPDESSLMIRELQAAVTAADVLCEEMTLLTLASSPELKALRRWMTREVVEQIELRRPAEPWTTWQDPGPDGPAGQG
ncbi:MAG: ATP-binding protein [Nocardioidaceae bacterium]|nr:ATP-binding protein [Nocardioidaceae bacterium]NUS50658.1 ATP-binding protein [Nocardioidaceae bacterium]